jgi:organic hydroperoxide reductase OsmC/OhrA
MHTHEAQIGWQRDDGDFAKGRYSRAHTWQFDGGISVAASPSPSIVPAPYSTAAAVDPEEALVAAAASCHMLTFLWVASKRGYVVDSYADRAVGILDKNAQGRLAITRITLKPQIVFSGAEQPTPEVLDALHHAAHDECYIANSVNCAIVVEAP